MQQKCPVSGKTFEITEKDLSFYEKMGVPVPKLHPDERQRRRLAWRNVFNLYHRKCDGTGKPTFSVFKEGSPFSIYSSEHWYGDSWSGLDYGRDFDFSRPFFPQFQELMHQVPQIALSVVNNQNSDFVNQCGWCKDSFFIFEADYNDTCLYSSNLYDSRQCVECLHVYNGELCYECVDCYECYDLRYSQNCQNCNTSWFLKNCIGCTNCFGCVNLRNKEYYFLNEPCTKEDYEAKLAEWDLGHYTALVELREHFSDFSRKFPHKHLQGNQNEDSSGDYLNNTQRCEQCYDIQKGQDCKYVFECRNTKNAHDISVFGSQQGIEWCYECHEIGDGTNNLLFCDQTWGGTYNLTYSKLCMNNAHDLFGCVGLKKQAYCIFNKQYDQKEYEALRSKIIAHMKETGEWGEFFPMSMSPFAYNETLAQDYFPLAKEEVLAGGGSWKEEDPKEYGPATTDPPATIDQVGDDICQALLKCETCGKNYRIQKQELKFYRKMNLPLPHTCFPCHHQSRMALRNPRVLHERACEYCSAPLQTTFAPDRPEPLCCEKCYLEKVD